MPHEMTATPRFGRDILVAIPIGWRAPLMRLGVALLVLLVLTFRDWAAMADKWWNISTYNHVLFVPLIIGWLIWNRRKGLALISPAAWWPGLIALGGALFLWLLGSMAGLNSASQLGAVGALIAVVVTILGLRIAAGCAFPLAYLVFLVPFGDELVPTLQMITADLVIFLTEWSGIPAVIDGVFIETPAGLFEVAEACSGVKFLVAMIAMGVLVSYACFRSWIRRAVFMTMAIAIPILANGVRAWGTIYIAQSQGVEFAEGFDHIFYGWVFFAVVVGILFAGAWKFFDRDPEDLGLDFPNAVQTAWFKKIEGFSAPGNIVAVSALGLIATFGMWFSFANRVEASVPLAVEAPMVPGWSEVTYLPNHAWEPRAAGADRRFITRYMNGQGQSVDVFVAIYGAQGEGREASAAGEGALIPGSDWRWLASSETDAQAQSETYLALGSYRRRTETSYRTGDLLTGSPMQLKLANMRDRLLLREAPTMMLILSTEIADEDEARAAIAKFRQQIGDEGIWLDRMAGLR